MFSGHRAGGIRVRTRIRAGAGEGSAGTNSTNNPGSTTAGTNPTGAAGGAALADAEKAELETLRKKARDFEKAEEAHQKAEKDKADAEALKRGEHEKLLATQKAELETAKREAAEAKLRAALVVAIGEEKLAKGALSDVVDVLVRQGAKLASDGKVEDLETKLTALKKDKPFYFAEGGAAGAQGQSSQAARGMPGTRPAAPPSAASGDLVVDYLEHKKRVADARPNPLKILHGGKAG